VIAIAIGAIGAIEAIEAIEVEIEKSSYLKMMSYYL
jgi:hypothetical protein